VIGHEGGPGFIEFRRQRLLFRAGDHFLIGVAVVFHDGQ
jgi:hypothetical protein